MIREGIKTEYRTKLNAVLEELEARKGSLKKKDVYAHPKYVSALVEYIVDDFLHSRIAMGDPTIGGMIVCDSSDQARMVDQELKRYTEVSHVLILHDVDVSAGQTLAHLLLDIIAFDVMACLCQYDRCR